MRACAMFSGGKDSTYSLHWAVLHGFKIAGLVTVVPSMKWNSMLYHYPHVKLTALQAKAMGFPHMVEEAGDSVDELTEVLTKARKRFGCSYLVSGALLSDYQRLRFAMASHAAGLKLLAPLWRKRQDKYLRWLVKDGFRFMLTSIQAYGLPPELLGRVVGLEEVELIIRNSRKYGFNPAFEGGEAETLTVDAPLFRMRLHVRGRARTIAPYHYIYEITEARLVPK